MFSQVRTGPDWCVRNWGGNGLRLIGDNQRHFSLVEYGQYVIEDHRGHITHRQGIENNIHAQDKKTESKQNKIEYKEIGPHPDIVFLV